MANQSWMEPFVLTPSGACNNWTRALSTKTAGSGGCYSKDTAWTGTSFFSSSCDSARRLYCFEDQSD